jgi:hypothetical protein
MVNWITPLAAALTFWVVLAFWVWQDLYRERAETEQRKGLAVVPPARAGTGAATTIVCSQSQRSAQ